jgi:hypothetical protein
MSYAHSCPPPFPPQVRIAATIATSHAQPSPSVSTTTVALPRCRERERLGVRVLSPPPEPGRLHPPGVPPPSIPPPPSRSRKSLGQCRRSERERADPSYSQQLNVNPTSPPPLPHHPSHSPYPEPSLRSAQNDAGLADPPPSFTLSRRSLAQRRRRQRERAVRSHTVQDSLHPTLPSQPIISTRSLTQRRRRQRERAAHVAHQQVC